MEGTELGVVEEAVQAAEELFATLGDNIG